MRLTGFTSLSVSSTPTARGAWPEGASDKPPACTMVYSMLLLLQRSIRYTSALRFHMTIWSPAPSPMLFRKLSFWVPVIVPTTTIFFALATFAASNWFRWPSQSTCSGLLPFQPKRNLIFLPKSFPKRNGKSDQIFNFGTAEVTQISATSPAKAFVSVSGCCTLPTKTDFSGNIGTFFSREALLFSEVTNARTSYRPVATNFSTTNRPVRPPAPVTRMRLPTAKAGDRDSQHKAASTATSSSPWASDPARAAMALQGRAIGQARRGGGAEGRPEPA
mmetsp:Transcript_23354/g.59629  ORF Transcript_23354/g.59629 Transcript_23354/m.59629 type:complete len:276 (+) Transcript_23354:226-1053(+)